MSDWTSGYVADIGYTYGYYPELNPLRLKLAFLNKGLVFPEFGAACELGFGQGMSAVMHATASITEWHGTDFNPAQAGFAQGLCNAAQVTAGLYDQSFEEFAARPDLPQFDYIGLHGIWSWISNENREIIVRFIRERLKVGGVVYISYNTQPGWASFGPVRHLLSLHAQVQGSEGRGTIGRIDGAFNFLDQLLATSPAYTKVNSQVPDRVQKVKAQNRQYLAHEYFNRDWLPIHFSTMAEWLEGAKLQFACSANPLDHIDGLNMTSEQAALLANIFDVNLRETTRDFLVNQQFRRDYWVKGVRKLNPLAQAEAIREQKVILASYRPDISLKVNGLLGEASMAEAIYGPILDYLADYRPHAIKEIEFALKDKDINFAQINQAIMVLVGAGYLYTAQDEEVIAKVRPQTDRMNAHVAREARGSVELGYLASPVTGGAIPVTRTQLLFLLAITEGKKEPSEWAQVVWGLLRLQGQSLVKDGKPLATVEENLAELTSQAKQFAEKRLPVLQGLQIV